MGTGESQENHFSRKAIPEGKTNLKCSQSRRRRLLASAWLERTKNEPPGIRGRESPNRGRPTQWAPVEDPWEKHGESQRRI